MRTTLESGFVSCDVKVDYMNVSDYLTDQLTEVTSDEKVIKSYLSCHSSQDLL